MSRIEALTGIRVFDASQGIAGPHATMLMALNGAEVIKVEPPGGDWSRVLGRSVAQQTIHSYAFNRAKRSIVIDLSGDRGRAVAQRIAAGCDICVESFRPGVAKRLGIGHEALSALNPQIITLSVSGFGQMGPYRDRPGVDGLLQAYTGMMVMNGGTGRPIRLNIVVIDIMTGLYGFNAVTMALMRRDRGAGGAWLDVSLAQCAAAFQSAKIMEYRDVGGNPPPLFTPSGIFEAADGFMLVSAMRDAHFVALCEIVGRPDLAASALYADIPSRNANVATLVPELAAAFLTREADHWIPALQEKGIMAERVNDYGDWLADEHVQAVQAVDTVEVPGFGTLPLAKIPGCPDLSDRPAHRQAPRPGADSRAILAGCGFAEPEVAELLATGIVTDAAQVE